MAVPKQHRSKSRQGQRRMHYFIKHQQLALCSHCGKEAQNHRACPSCGYYKGKEVVNTLAKAKKTSKKSQ